ncbi:MAG: hypothetical protein M0R80_14305 [Proteobacteria bacterium]|jgi:predicted CxxxxCH...CXXCH cytochrome family protein|nr:hypothetical protein [Pseudomonadota bacterium]
MTRRPRLSRPFSLALGALLAIAPAACMEVLDDRENDGGASDGACGQCHGAQGNSDAHAAHVSGNGTYGKAFACSECHPVPASGGYDGTHLNAAVDVVFPEGGLARADGAEPVWSSSSYTCAGVYCHGATLGGGTLTEPDWYAGNLNESLGGPSIPCGSCHSIPPPSPHPSDDECKSCHEDAYNDHALDPGFHINGEVDFEDEGEDDGVGARP